MDTCQSNVNFKFQKFCLKITKLLDGMGLSMVETTDQETQLNQSVWRRGRVGVRTKNKLRLDLNWMLMFVTSHSQHWCGPSHLMTDLKIKGHFKNMHF